jgi:hypothetical protein
MSKSNIIFSGYPGKPDTELRESAPFVFQQIESGDHQGEPFYEVVKDNFNPSQEGEVFTSSEIFEMLHEAGEV